MSLKEIIKRKIVKKIARRVTKEYPAIIKTIPLSQEGVIQFASWSNPLVKPFTITQNMVDFFKRFVKPGDLAIDIGANIGDTTVPMALAAGPAGLVLAFDPNPMVFKILEQNARLNPGKQNIRPFLFAITQEEAEFYYISSEASFANGAISPTRQSQHGRFIYPHKIKGIKLEDFLETQFPDRINRLSFIKIDAEGYDKEIIKSIRELILRYKPVVVAESFGKATYEAKIELYDVLAGMDYDIFQFDDFYADTRVEQITSGREMARQKHKIDIYGTPKSSS